MQLNATGQNLSEIDFVRSHKIAIVSACSQCKVRARARGDDGALCGLRALLLS